MAARDTHISCARRRHDDHITGGCYHPWPPYRWTSSNWDICARCGGVLRGAARCHPLADALRGSAISIQWLCDQLSTPAPNADEVAIKRSVLGFILVLMVSFLFANKKGVHVHLYFLPLLRDLTHTTTYSWGGVVLAHTFASYAEPTWIVNTVLAVVLH